MNRPGAPSLQQPPSTSDVRHRISERNRRCREIPGDVIAALLANDQKRLQECLAEADCCLDGLRRVFRRCAALTSAVPAEMQRFMLRKWLSYGDHLRCETGDDLVLMSALRKLLPPYTGGGLTLYRGDGALNRRRRTYGLSWTTSREVAEAHAGVFWRTTQGGSVLLRVDAPAEAIICAPLMHTEDNYGEEEYLVDRRQLRRVAVVARYVQIQPGELV